jgi:sodium transport system ATP-binding protein
MALIEVEGLSKSYLDKARGVVHAVNNVSFQCRAGEITGLLGPNGAGKTTTLRMLATVLQPTTGVARVANYDVQTDSLRVRQNLGFLTGGTGLYGRLSPIEILRFFGRLHEMPEDRLQQRMDSLIRSFGIEEFKNSNCDRLSTGQKQRVNLARTVLHDPPVIILDEPTAGLDLISSRSILEFVRNKKEEGKCILFSTHNMTEAEILCDRIAIILDGEIQIMDTLEGLKQTTAQNSLVDAFLHLVKQHETQDH